MSRATKNHDLSSDIRTIHSIITRGFATASREARTRAGGGSLAGTPEGLFDYVGTLFAIFNHHHHLEDHSVFPEFIAKKADGPYAQLSSEHEEMHRAEEVVVAAIDDLRGDTGNDAKWVALADSLEALQAAWNKHIELEETVFSPEIVNAALTQAEQNDRHSQYSKDAQQNTGPGSRVLPFMLYHLQDGERHWIADELPWFVKKILVGFIWKGDWRGMRPYLPYAG